MADTAQRRRARKTVSIVFSDITGSTDIGERLDPESISNVMRRYSDEMRNALERNGGCWTNSAMVAAQPSTVPRAVLTTRS